LIISLAVQTCAPVPKAAQAAFAPEYPPWFAASLADKPAYFPNGLVTVGLLAVVVPKLTLLKLAFGKFATPGSPEGWPKAIIGMAMIVVTIKSEIRIESLLFSTEVCMCVLVIFFVF
jgi:hypothetical protein